MVLFRVSGFRCSVLVTLFAFRLVPPFRDSVPCFAHMFRGPASWFCFVVPFRVFVSWFCFAVPVCGSVSYCRFVVQVRVFRFVVPFRGSVSWFRVSIRDW